MRRPGSRAYNGVHHMAQVKASAVLARAAFVKDSFGEEGFQRLLAALPREQSELLGGVLLPQEWVPYDLFIGVNVEADRLFGDGDLKLCTEMGRNAADRNLTTLYKMFYRLSSVHFILSRAATLWRVHYDTGRLVVGQKNRGSALIRIEDFEGLHRAHCLSVLGWAWRSIELSGGNDASGRIKSYAGSNCEMAFTWS